MSDRTPDKVVITCTADEFSVVVMSGENEVVREINQFVGRVECRPVKKVDWRSSFPDAPEFADELDAIGTTIFSCFGIARELREIREEVVTRSER